MARKPPKYSGDELFKKRLRREGRYEEMRLKCTSLCRDDGLTGLEAYHRCRKEFGYLGADGEREAQLEFEAGASSVNVDRTQEAYKRVRAARNKSYEVAEACAGLPDTVSPSKEVDWIRCHPAMNRAKLLGASKADLVITVEDIITPPHGPAPSKAAVIALQQWVYKPDEFFKMILSEQRKNTGQDGDDVNAEEVKDPTVAEVNKMLAGIESRRVQDGSEGDAEDAGARGAAATGR